MQHALRQIIDGVELRVVPIALGGVREVHAGHVAEVPEDPEVGVAGNHARLEDFLAHRLRERPTDSLVVIQQPRVAGAGLEQSFLATRAGRFQVDERFDVLRPSVLRDEPVRGSKRDFFGAVEQEDDRVAVPAGPGREDRDQFQHDCAVGSVVGSAGTSRHRVEVAIDHQGVRRVAVQPHDDVLDLPVNVEHPGRLEGQKVTAGHDLVVQRDVLALVGLLLDRRDSLLEEVHGEDFILDGSDHFRAEVVQRLEIPPSGTADEWNVLKNPKNRLKN